jgi:hypothetical protein
MISQHESPEIHNSVQGSQYKSELYLNTLKDNEIQISMNYPNFDFQVKIIKNILNILIKIKKTISWKK